MRWSAWLAVLAACSSPAPSHAPAPAAPAPVAPAPAPAAPPIVVDARAVVLDAAPHVGGKLAQPAPGPSIVWPTRVCTDGHALRFENDCGCNDALLCEVRATTAPTIEIALRTDPTRMHTCDDCFAMVPARCVLPALAPGAWRVEINGVVALTLDVDPAGRFADNTCWGSP